MKKYQNIRVPVGLRDSIKKTAKEKGLTVISYLRLLLRNNSDNTKVDYLKYKDDKFSAIAPTIELTKSIMDEAEKDGRVPYLYLQKIHESEKVSVYNMPIILNEWCEETF